MISAQAKESDEGTIDEDIVIPNQRILVHCSAGRGRTGLLIATFLIAEHLLNIAETVNPSKNREHRAIETSFTSEQR